MAYVATPRFESVMRLSMSTLQLCTAAGRSCASSASVRTAANLSTERGEDKNICRTEIAFVCGSAGTPGIVQSARAAS